MWCGGARHNTTMNDFEDDFTTDDSSSDGSSSVGTLETKADEENARLLSLSARLLNCSRVPASVGRMFQYMVELLMDVTLDDDVGEVIRVCCEALDNSIEWRRRQDDVVGCVERCLSAAEFCSVWRCLYVASAFRTDFQPTLPRVLYDALEPWNEEAFHRVEEVCGWAVSNWRVRAHLPNATDLEVALSRAAPRSFVAYYTWIDAADARNSIDAQFVRWYFASGLRRYDERVPDEFRRIVEREGVFGGAGSQIDDDLARGVVRWMNSARY